MLLKGYPMNRNHMKQLLYPFIFVAGIGFLLHFTYENSGKSFLVSIISAVNESTWEHLKLLFFPMLLLTIYQIFHEKWNTALIPGNLLATLAGMAFIIIAFYTCLGVIGHNVDVLNIIIYLLAVLLTLWLSWRLREIYHVFHPVPACILAAILIILFAVFTYYPPSIGLFYDPAQIKY